jgi:hypothetical protein
VDLEIVFTLEKVKELDKITNIVDIKKCNGYDLGFTLKNELFIIDNHRKTSCNLTTIFSGYEKIIKISCGFIASSLILTDKYIYKLNYKNRDFINFTAKGQAYNINRIYTIKDQEEILGVYAGHSLKILKKDGLYSFEKNKNTVKRNLENFESSQFKFFLNEKYTELKKEKFFEDKKVLSISFDEFNNNRITITDEGVFECDDDDKNYKKISFFDTFDKKSLVFSE